MPAVVMCETSARYTPATQGDAQIVLGGISAKSCLSIRTTDTLGTKIVDEGVAMEFG